MSTLRSALGDRDFRWVWLGQGASAIGDNIFVVAIALHVLDAGHGPEGLGAVMAARAVALVALLVAGGVLADRVRRTRVMVAADVVRGAAVVLLALLPPDVPLWALAALAATIGGGEALFRPAFTALVPMTVEADRLQQANALVAATLRLAAVVGPAAGGALMAVAGTRAAFAVDAATFGVSMLTLLAVNEVRTFAVERRPVLQEALEGARAVRDRPWVAWVLAIAGLHMAFAVAPALVLLPVIARSRLGGTAAYSTVLVVFGVGALAGAVLAARWHPRRAGVIALAGLLPFAGALLALAAPAPVAVVAATFGLAALGHEVFGVHWTTALQRDVPPHLLARVSSLDWLVSFGLLPVGLALTGPLVAAVGRTTVLVAGAAVVVATTVGALMARRVTRFAS